MKLSLLLIIPRILESTFAPMLNVFQSIQHWAEWIISSHVSAIRGIKRESNLCKARQDLRALECI